MQDHSQSDPARAGNHNTQDPSARRVLIVTAVEAEREAVMRGLRNADGFEVIAAGVGPAAAAAVTASRLARSAYRLVISAGIAGGFDGRAEVGGVVIADSIIAADLGSETADGFASVRELGFGNDRIETETAASNRLAEALKRSGLPASLGPILTVSTTTGSAERAAALAAQVPGAAAEGMEGFGVATAAALAQVPVMEIRAISNKVGPRDRSAWRIPEALRQLETASSLLPEVLS